MNNKQCEQVEKYRPLVVYVLKHLRERKPAVRRLGWDDAYDAGVYGLVIAVHSYDKSKNASLKTHAFNCIRNYIMAESRLQFLIRVPHRVVQALSEGASDSDVDGDGYEWGDRLERAEAAIKITTLGDRFEGEPVEGKVSDREVHDMLVGAMNELLNEKEKDAIASATGYLGPQHTITSFCEKHNLSRHSLYRYYRSGVEKLRGWATRSGLSFQDLW